MAPEIVVYHEKGQSLFCVIRGKVMLAIFGNRFDAEKYAAERYTKEGVGHE